MEVSEASAVFAFRLPFKLNMEAAGSSETSVNFYPTTWRHKP